MIRILDQLANGIALLCHVYPFRIDVAHEYNCYD